MVKKALRFFISLVLIIILIYQVDITKSIEIISKANLFWVVMAILAAIANIILSSLRIQYILKIFNLSRKLFYLCKIYIIGNFYNNFLPTQMGGDIYKAVRLSNDLKKHESTMQMEHSEVTAKASFAIFMDRLSGLIILYLIGLIAMGINFGLIGFAASILTFALSVILYYIIITYLAKKVKFVAKFKEANKIFIKYKSKVLNVFFTALVVQIFAIYTQIFCFYAIGITDLSIAKAFLYLPVITIMGLIPSINGLGVQDAGFVYFFTQIGITTEEALAASIMYHIIRFVVSAFGGLILLTEAFKYDKNI